jgi:4-hydroxybutyryl-CoA dehydratase / vinylacetyl-CoA-Delta-isomerase
MRTQESYLDSLKDGRQVYYRGRLVSSIPDHPTLKVAAKHASKLYVFPKREYFDETLGQNVSRYFKVPLNSQDLLERHKLIYDTTVACNGIFNISQAIGSDALFSLIQIVRKMKNNEYSTRVSEYFVNIRKKDLTLAVAQTDVKGDRRKRPSEQEDKDMYVHVVEKNDQGIVVSGAKAHTTQSIVADEIITIPTRTMTEKDRDYALAFAVPASTKGLKFIARPVEEIEGNSMNVLSSKDYEIETLTIFDNVQVPWERVFLFGEHEFAGPLALNFVKYHRFTALSYRCATSNIYLGTASLVGKANGVSDAPHTRNNLVNMIVYKEFMRMSALAAASEAVMDEGLAVPNPLYTNIGKLYSNQNFTRILESLVDISGGIIATMPSREDLENPEEKSYIEKYLRGATSGEERIKVLKIAKELITSSLAGYMMTLMIHAEGSLEASRLAILKDYDLSEPEKIVEKILGPSA